MAKALKTTSLRIEIRYYADRVEWEVLEPDTRKSQEAVRRKQKWRPYSSGAANLPSWEDLHKVDSVLVNAGVRNSHPADVIHSRVKYDVHCLRIERTKRAKLKAPD